MVTNSLDVIIAKTHIDQLNGIPLIDIDYRLNKPFNRFLKRIFDIVGTISIWIFFAPMKRAFKEKIHYNSLSRVLSGTYSIVGNPIKNHDQNTINDSLVKPGLTGLMQINKNNNVSTSEIERYNLLYAKNYSLFLDFEILIKTIVNIFKNR
jgi:hypothetical protein